MRGVLGDLVVLDLTRFLSGPYCTLLLAGQGAEVIKIDDPHGGDPTADAPPFAGRDGVGFERCDASDLGIAYLKRARGKRSMTINLKHVRGRDLFLRLCAHPDFARVQWRMRNNEQVDREVGEWVGALTVAGVVCCLDAVDVACTPVRTPRDALDWPQLRSRGMVGTLRLPDGTPTEALASGLPMRYSRSSGEQDRPAPVPGGDTHAVLARLLGLSEDEVAALRRDGVV